MTEGSLHLNPEAAVEMAANAVLGYLHQSNVEGEQQKRQWLARVFDRAKAKEFTH